MFRASSAYLQEDTVVHVQHMVLSLSMRFLGGLSVHSLNESILLFVDSYRMSSLRIYCDASRYAFCQAFLHYISPP